ncbi:MAG: nucleotide exchange factor GrpE [Rubrobacter sp.]|nr:nucleotide exchange factor GrpE [Rubrobacter sp.]
MNSEENNRERRDEQPEEQPAAESSEEAVEGEVVPEGHDDPAENPAAFGAETDDEAELSDEEKVAALSQELESVRAERDEHLDSVKRLRAEFENTRKRAERERERVLQSASEKLVTDLLPVLDNLDRALQSEGDIRDGVRSTRDQFVSVLEEEGLAPVESDGETFDPNVHEAVMGQPSEEHEDGTVIQTFERGYVLNGKSIRPAKVVVARQG